MSKDLYSQADLQQKALGNMSTAVLMFDNNLELIYANPAAEMLFAQSVRHLLGKSYTELIQYREEGDADLEQDIRAGQSFTRHELPLLLYLDKLVTVDLTVMPVKQADSNSYLLEMRQVDRWLRITRDEKRAMQQEVTQEILRGLAHEVKNPLGGLRGAAQLLERELDVEELKEYTQVIISEADRLQALVNRILGPTGLPEMNLVNIHEVLERVRSLMLVDKSHQIEIHRDYDPSIPELTADANMLIQAILNIVKNAIEAMGGSGNIILRTRAISNYTINQERVKLVVRIEIIDDGPGISEEIREKLFFPMVTGRAEGSGLGLSITQTLIQQHNGLVECNSEPGKTMFAVVLPIT